MSISETKKKFAFDVGWVFLSTVIVFILHFFQNPVMAKFLGPSGLGLFSMVVMIGGIISLIAGLGIESAIVKYVAEYKKDKNTLDALFSSGLITRAFLGTTAGVVLFMFSDTLASIFNMPSLSFLLKIYAFVFPFLLTYEGIMGLFKGLREMKYFSLINTLQGILSFSFILAILFAGFGVRGAVEGQILAVIIVFLLSSITMRKFVNFSISNYKKNVKKLASFGTQVMFANTINLVNYQADILLIGYFLTATVVAYYAFAVLLCCFFWRIPRSFQIVSSSAKPEYWTRGEIHSLNKLIDKSMKYSAFLLLIVGLGTWLFAKDIIIFLFGESFIPSIFPLRILLVGTVLFGIVKSIGGTLPAIGRPDLSLKITTTGAIANVVLNILFIPHLGIAGAATATVTSLIIISILLIYYISKLTKASLDLKWYALVFMVTLLAMLVFSICSEWVKSYFLGSLILCAYIALFFKFFLTREDKVTFKELIRSIVSKMK